MNPIDAAREFGREIAVASRVAREAGDAILKIYAGDFAVRFKGEGDPVTEADRLASSLIVGGLLREFPDDLVVSEEEPLTAPKPLPNRVWYVDPLDGTAEFIARNGEFAVMIGLAVDGRAQVGVVFRPVTRELFCGITDKIAWREHGDRSEGVRVSDVEDPARLRLAVSRSHRHSLIDVVRSRLGITRELRCGSVGLKVGLLVTRQADVYIDLSSLTNAWDSCAPEAILHGAGGRLTDLAGAPLRYSPRDLRNRRGLVATNGVCHDGVISAIAPVARAAGLI